MSDQADQPKSYVIIRFADVGSVLFQATMDGVTPLQLIAIGEYLSIRGKNNLLQQENERLEHEKQQQLAVPKPEIIVPGR